MARMERTDRDIGCFQWVATLKKSFNERWARARNRLIRLVRRRDATVHTADLVNETGTPDIVLNKRFVSPSPRDIAVLEQMTHVNSELVKASPKINDVDDQLTHADPELVKASPSSSANDLDMKAFAASYVKDVVKSAQAKLQAESGHGSTASLTSSAMSDLAGQFSRTILINEQVKLEAEARRTSPESMTSSQAEDIAELAVQDSLTRIAANTNASALRRPKTARELIESLGLGSFDEEDGLPRVDM